jgi:hypothetical protein
MKTTIFRSGPVELDISPLGEVDITCDGLSYGEQGAPRADLLRVCRQFRAWRRANPAQNLWAVCEAHTFAAGLKILDSATLCPTEGA